MRGALTKAGFTEVVFEHEPVGAAARYAATLERDELIVVADLLYDFCPTVTKGGNLQPESVGFAKSWRGIGGQI